MSTRAPQFLEIPLGGTRSGSFPLTWGQAWVWSGITTKAPHYADLSGCYVIAVPDGCDMPTIADALSTILRTNETFRTRYAIAHDGTPQQIVFADGTLRVEVRDCDAADAEATAASIEDEFIRLPFTLPELPLRAAVVTSDGIPKFVVLCVFSMAMDCHALVFVLDEFKSLMSGVAADAGRPTLDGTTHPVDRALEEQSTEGVKRSAQGVQYWTEELVKFPDAPLPYTDRRPESPRYKTFAMRSATVRLATLEVADQLGVGTSSVILAMAASLLGKRIESERVGIVIGASHRYDPESMQHRGTLVQAVPAAIDLPGGSPHELITKTHRAAMLAALAGHCHPDDVDEMLRNSYGDMAKERLACVVNLNLPTPADMTDAKATGATRADAEGLLIQSSYEYVEGTPVESEKFYLTAHGDATDFYLTLRADTSVLGSEDIVQFLQELERSLLDCLPLR